MHKEKYFRVDNNPPFILIHLILSLALEKKATLSHSLQKTEARFGLFKYCERSPEVISTTI